MPGPREPPRRRCCTTRTSLTRSRLRGPSTSRAPQALQRKDTREKVSRARELVREISHAALYLVPDRANFLDRRARRVREVPVHIALPGKHRARVAAAHRHDDLGPLDILLRDPLRAPSGQIHPDLAHGLE